MSATDVVFLSAVRTPFGTFGGTLRDVPVSDFTTVAAKAAIERARIDATDIDSAIFGNVLYTAADSVYFSRHVSLRAGMKEESSALTLNRLCGSGFQSVVSGAQEIMLGDSNVCLVGGADSMSQAPHVARVRWGVPLGKSPQLEDTLWAALTDSYAGLAMAETAENLAEKYHLDRAGIDEFALRSQQLARDAWAAGAFKDEIVAVPVRNPKTKKDELFEKDEHMRPESTIEGLAKLKPVFRENGVVTAGNASGIGDGAGALVISSAKFAKDRGIAPIGRLISWGIAGVDPKIMGIGPVPAAK
jgi:acetyl-CoA acetyltransferase family protein